MLIFLLLINLFPFFYPVVAPILYCPDLRDGIEKEKAFRFGKACYLFMLIHIKTMKLSLGNVSWCALYAS